MNTNHLLLSPHVALIFLGNEYCRSLHQREEDAFSVGKPWDYSSLGSGVFPLVTLVTYSLGVGVMRVDNADRASRYCFSRVSGYPLG